jgi:hypothetical protein
MRAREFIVEHTIENFDSAQLSDNYSYPMHDTFILPGIRNNDAYKSYRFGVAMARARAIIGDQDQDLPPWHATAALGPNAVVAGFNNTVDPVIDLALKMADVPGGKQQVGSNKSQEPPGGQINSPIKPFKGYPR